MKRITLTFDDDGELKKETHFVIGGNDYSICGHDIAGDSDLGYAEGKETHKPYFAKIQKRCEELEQENKP
jgi:hypothetical protein